MMRIFERKGYEEFWEVYIFGDGVKSIEFWVIIKYVLVGI